MLKDRPTHHMLVVVCLSFSVAIHAAYSYCINNTQRASHPRPPDFHADLWGKSRGLSLRKFPHDFPAEMKGK